MLNKMLGHKCCPSVVIDIPAAAECSSEQFHPVATGPLSPSDCPIAERSGKTHHKTSDPTSREVLQSNSPIRTEGLEGL